MLRLIMSIIAWSILDKLLTICGHIKIAEQRTIIEQYGGWYTGRLWVGCYIWYSEEGPGRAAEEGPAALRPRPVSSSLYQM